MSHGRRLIVSSVLVFIIFNITAVSAFSLTVLRQVQVSDGVQVDLLFDKQIAESQVKVEYLRDIVQISLKDISVYPAKIFSVMGPDLKKVFAYQYTPSVVRCRLTVNETAEKYKNQINIETKGKILTVKINSKNSDKVSTSSASAKKATDLEAKSIVNRQNSAEETALLQNVMKNKTPSEKSLGRQVKTTNSKTDPTRLTSGNSIINLTRTIGAVVLVFGLLGIVLLLLKKIAKKSGKAKLISKSKTSNKDIAGSVARLFMRNKLKKDNSEVEIISNHQLDAKKSIAIVRVASRKMVLGVTDESINLIANLSDYDNELVIEESNYRNQNENITKEMGTGAESAGHPIFADLLGSAVSRPRTMNNMNNKTSTQKPSSGVNIRDKIRGRIEGMKKI